MYISTAVSGIESDLRGRLFQMIIKPARFEAHPISFPIHLGSGVLKYIEKRIVRDLDSDALQYSPTCSVDLPDFACFKRSV